jgi:pyruvate kinase
VLGAAILVHLQRRTPPHARPPRRPIIAVNRRQAVQQLALEWGVVPAQSKEAEHVEDLWSRSIEAARETGLVAAGDRIVLTAGTAVNVPGTTNVIKVETA